MREKIIELFEYRKLPLLLNKGSYSLKSPLAEKLIDLQVKIYELDTYLESTWKIKTKELNKYWKNIHTSLYALGIPKDRIPEYVKHILRYQKHELAMRKGKMPNSLSIEFYYFYKSCDVKLLRKIIYDYIPSLKVDYTLSDWRQFDLITEINDDVEDLFEDLDIINGNYFLFELRENGKAYTRKKFNAYLKVMEQESKQRISTKSSRTQKLLKDWSVLNSKDTRKLVDKQVKLFTHSSAELPVG